MRKRGGTVQEKKRWNPPKFGVISGAKCTFLAAGNGRGYSISPHGPPDGRPAAIYPECLRHLNAANADRTVAGFSEAARSTFILEVRGTRG
jgi:hypothetical protein